METYKKIETRFEKLANRASLLFASPLVFIAAVILVAFWFSVTDWSHTRLADGIRDIILAITFLSFFIIQRTFLHFSQALHLKVNELVAAHDKARNEIIMAEKKTGEEIAELGKEHDRIVQQEQK
jgi:low affinity Fe/Cu permease